MEIKHSLHSLGHLNTTAKSIVSVNFIFFKSVFQSVKMDFLFKKNKPVCAV